jgi:thiol-disulfide isomerase/thioredoxin
MLTGLLVAVVVLGVVCAFNLALILRLSKIVREQPASAPAAASALPDLGTEIPSFVGVTTAGRPLSSAELTTGTVLVTFLSATCQPCRDSLPRLAEVGIDLRSIGARSLAVLSAPSQSDPADMVDALSDGSDVIAADGYHDPRFSSFGVTAYPTFLLFEHGRLTGATHALDELALPVTA